MKQQASETASARMSAQQGELSGNKDHLPRRRKCLQDVPNEAATSKVYKESLQLNRKKNAKDWKKKLKTPTERWANGDFPDGPVLRNPPSNAGDTSLVPGQGTEIPHALGQLSQLGPQPRPNKTEMKQKGKAGKCVEETFLQKNT